MGQNEQPRESLVDMAKRWLKLQLGFHGDPRRAHREREESEVLEERMRERTSENVSRAAYEAFAPAGLKRKVNELQRYQADQREAAETRRKAEHDALPRAALRLSVSGSYPARLEQDVPAVVSWPEGEDEALTVGLEPWTPLALDNHQFYGMQFAIPTYKGPGRYDLNAMATGPGAEDWDPLWYQLFVDGTDEPFYWVPEYGPASVTVEPDERTIHVRMAMEDAGSVRLDVDATITIPATDQAAPEPPLVDPNLDG